MFVYGQPQLTASMKRNKIKGVKKNKANSQKNDDVKADGAPFPSETKKASKSQ